MGPVDTGLVLCLLGQPAAMSQDMGKQCCFHLVQLLACVSLSVGRHLTEQHVDEHALPIVPI